MEMIGGLFGMMTGAIGTGTATVGSTALTALQGAGTLFGALATIGSGAAANATAQAEAQQQQFEAREEFVSGKETSAALKAELARTVSNQAVAFAAGGVDLGSVSVQQAKQQAIKDAETELDLNDNQSLSRSLQRQRAARVARARGRSALFSSVVGAGQQIANYRVDVAQRGLNG